MNESEKIVVSVISLSLGWTFIGAPLFMYFTGENPKPTEKNYPQPSKLEIISKDINMNDSTETILYDKSKNTNYLLKCDSTGNLNLIPYEIKKPEIIEK